MARAHHETAIQAELVKSLKESGHFAKKLSHSALVGIPDLLINIKDTGRLSMSGTLLTEVKLTDNKRLLKHPLTVPQYRCLKEWALSGGAALVLVVHRKSPGVYDMGVIRISGAMPRWEGNEFPAIPTWFARGQKEQWDTPFTGAVSYARWY